ncbi:BQ2448_5910 [Microbotryum intermedium]|uniref:Large ribosomal subunit protein mL49 n=1 Tax=Microbotryum intermedium TaxID=269621 RepID=A0A238F5Z3_9BASI|nr:BQ2448_5910 [Microbotryum intermedium]
MSFLQRCSRASSLARPILASRPLASTPSYSYAYSTVVAPALTPVSSPLPIQSEPTQSTSSLETATKPKTTPNRREPGPRMLPYFVRRTAGGELPVYVDVLHGGSKRLTLIRKIDGDLEALKRDLSQYLVGISNYVKPHARQVVVKGDYVRQTKEWLAAMGF